MEKEQDKSNLSACQEIAPGVYGMETGKGIMRSNVYFVRSGSSWTLMDAASQNYGEVIRKTAETLFGANTRPTSILLTHDHPDHAGSAVELARMWDCPVFVHPDEMNLVDIKDLSTIVKYGGPLDRWMVYPLLKAMPRWRVEAMLQNASLKEVVHALTPGAAIPGLPDWECIPTPGHTPGHVAFFRASDRLLITGDALLTVNLNSFWGTLFWGLRLNQQAISGPPWYSSWNWQAARKSITTLAGVEPHVLAPGHGKVISGGDTANLLQIFANRFSGI